MDDEITPGLVPGDVPDFVKEAEAQMAAGVQIIEERKEIAIKFGKGLVGEPFLSKNGKELVEVKIPNVDKKDKSPWASFVISPKMIHNNKFGKGVWMKLPENGTTKIKKPIFIGKNPEGKNIWENDYKEISNTELKAMMEAYKTRNQTADRDSFHQSTPEDDKDNPFINGEVEKKPSVIEKLAEKKREAAKQPVRNIRTKTGNLIR